MVVLSSPFNKDIRSFKSPINKTKKRIQQKCLYYSCTYHWRLCWWSHEDCLPLWLDWSYSPHIQALLQQGNQWLLLLSLYKEVDRPNENLCKGRNFDHLFLLVFNNWLLHSLCKAHVWLIFNRPHCLSFISNHEHCP